MHLQALSDVYHPPSPPACQARESSPILLRTREFLPGRAKSHPLLHDVLQISHICVIVRVRISHQCSANPSPSAIWGLYHQLSEGEHSKLVTSTLFQGAWASECLVQNRSVVLVVSIEPSGRGTTPMIPMQIGLFRGF